MRATSRSIGLAMVAWLVSAGCARVPQIHYYLLDIPEKDAPGSNIDSPSRPGLRVGVENFLVSSPYDRDRIVYRVGSDSLEVGFYAYHRWASPLSRMMAEQTAAGLGKARGIALIEPVMPDRSYTAFLDGRLLALEEVDIAGGHEARLRVAMSLRLEDGTIVWSDTLEGKAVTDTDTVDAVVEQMNKALAEALARARVSLERRLEE